jgi:hypothetical protein
MRVAVPGKAAIAAVAGLLILAAIGVVAAKKHKQKFPIGPYPGPAS